MKISNWKRVKFQLLLRDEVGYDNGATWNISVRGVLLHRSLRKKPLSKGLRRTRAFMFLLPFLSLARTHLPVWGRTIMRQERLESCKVSSLITRRPNS